MYDVTSLRDQKSSRRLHNAVEYGKCNTLRLSKWEKLEKDANDDSLPTSGPMGIVGPAYPVDLPKHLTNGPSLHIIP